jgi:LPXTG-motif cell wall-anchored protein
LGGILAGVGLLFTSVFPNAIDTGTTNTQPDPSVQQKQLERTGQNVVIVIVIGAVALIGGLIYAFRKKDD